MVLQSQQEVDTEAIIPQGQTGLMIHKGEKKIIVF